MVEQNVRRHQAVTSPPRGEPTARRAGPPQARIPPPLQVVDPGHVLTHILESLHRRPAFADADELHAAS